jgi:WD40 repeat protein/tetratricopeptide (TPR) repeat protein
VFDTETGLQMYNLFRSFAGGDPVYSPDGTRMVRRAADGTVTLYDQGTGKEVARLPGAPWRSPRFSPDGKWLFESSPAKEEDRLLRFYDAETGAAGRVISTVNRWTRPVFSPDGTRVATTEADGMVRVYDVRKVHEAIAAKASFAVFSPDQTRVAVGYGPQGDEAVLICDARTGEIETIFPRSDGIVRFPPPVFSPDGTRIAFSRSLQFDKGRVQIHDVRTGEELLALHGPQRSDYLAFSPEGQRIAVIPAAFHDDREARIVEARTGRELLAFTLPRLFGSPVFSKGGNRLAVVHQLSRDVRIHDAGTGEVIFSPPDDPAAMKALTMAHARGVAIDDIFSPDRTLFGPVGGGILSQQRPGHFYDFQTGRRLFSVESQGSPFIPSHMFSPDGARVATNERARNGDPVVRIRDARTGKEIASVRGAERAEAFNLDGTRLAVRGVANTAWVCDVRSGRELFTLKGLNVQGKLVFSPDNTRLAFAGAGEVRLYDGMTGQEVYAFNTKSTIDNLQFSPDGTRMILSGRSSDTLLLHAPRDLQDWQRLRGTGLAKGVTTWQRVQVAECHRTGRWFAAALHGLCLIKAEPDRGVHHFRRGLAVAHLSLQDDAKASFEAALAASKGLEGEQRVDALAMLGRWAEAEKESTSAGERPAAWSWLWFKQALLRLHLGDAGGYRQACARALERLGPRHVVTIECCALGPAAVPDFSPLLSAGTPRADETSHCSFGAILFRAGKPADAAARLLQAVKLNGKGGSAETRLLLALTHHALGKPDEAKKWLDLARQAIGKDPPVFWTNRLQLELLRREAEALILPAPKDTHD